MGRAAGSARPAYRARDSPRCARYPRFKGGVHLKPLSDLHCHLDGSLRPSTLRELAARAGREVPKDLPFSPGMGLRPALAKFAFTLSLLQEPAAVRRVASEMCGDARADGVDALEIRFAPQLHVRGGAALEEIVGAALEGAAGRAGIVLCGLYGEPPEVLDSLVSAAEGNNGVVGIDLAGGPSTSDRWSMGDYIRPFRRAADAGLGRTVHAGEGRPASEIRFAIGELRAQRIGHGCSVLEDPAVVELARERGVTFEACLTSNVHTGVYRSAAEHPLPKWLAAGLRACICSDNTLLSATTASEEHRRALSIPGMTPELLDRAIAFGHEGRFHRS